MRALLVVILILTASAVQAAQQNTNSSYIGGQAGLTVLPDLDITQFGFTESLATDVGFNFGGVAGYKRPSGLRAEGELSYRQNSTDSLTFFGATFPIDGDVSSFTIMANVWYDIDTGSNWVPYLGGGAGVAFVSADLNVGGFSLANDNDTAFAWQLGAGVGYRVAAATVVSADYRWLAAADLQMTDAIGDPFELEYSSHNFMLSVRQYF